MSSFCCWSLASCRIGTQRDCDWDCRRKPDGARANGFIFAKFTRCLCVGVKSVGLSSRFTYLGVIGSCRVLESGGLPITKDAQVFCLLRCRMRNMLSFSALFAYWNFVYIFHALIINYILSPSINILQSDPIVSCLLIV